MSNVINTHATNLRDEIQSVNLIGEVIVNLHVLDRDPALESVEHLDSFSQRIKLRAEEETINIGLLLPKSFRPYERLLLTLQTAFNRIKGRRWRGSRRHGRHNSSSLRCGCRSRTPSDIFNTHPTGHAFLEAPKGATA